MQITKKWRKFIMADKNNSGDVNHDPGLTIPPVSIQLEQEKYDSFDLGQASHILHNIPYAKAFILGALIDYAQGKIVSQTFVQHPGVSLTLFAFAAGEGLAPHQASCDALVCAVEGSAEITIDGKPAILAQGECIVMPTGHPHGIKARENFKMFLIQIFPEG